SLEDEDRAHTRFLVEQEGGLPVSFRSYHVVLAVKALRAAFAVLERAGAMLRALSAALRRGGDFSKQAIPPAAHQGEVRCRNQHSFKTTSRVRTCIRASPRRSSKTSKPACGRG